MGGSGKNKERGIGRKVNKVNVQIKVHFLTNNILNFDANHR